MRRTRLLLSNSRFPSRRIYPYGLSRLYRVMVYAFALLVLQGGTLELAALTPYTPAIATALASGVTGTATLLAARRTGRGSREASALAKKHEAIGAVNAAFFDLSVSFDEWLNPPTERTQVRTAGERVDRALKKLKHTWNTHRYLFAGTKTSVIVGKTISKFDFQYRTVSGVMLIGKARSPHYDETLGDAREWLDDFERRWQVELNDYFSRESGSVSAGGASRRSRYLRAIRRLRLRRFRTRLEREMAKPSAEALVAKALERLDEKPSQDTKPSQEFRSRLELESGYSEEGGHHNG